MTCVLVLPPMEFVNTYAALPESFYERALPAPVRSPRLFLWNDRLADELRLDAALRADKAALAEVFGGNRELPGSAPMALAYAGHQFGNFVPSLGDGRAHLLGEVVDTSGKGRDLQLKGSGPTGFSRGGDGRCALGPAIREFIMSEAMFALGVPTTRSLCVVATGEKVYRPEPLPGAVVTRVAASHLRVGTFQYFAARGDHQALRRLAEYAIERHYPDIPQGDSRFITFVDRVIEEQIETVVHWMRVGFIHGVMNTDNMTISGETIDYGPCAMMSAYDPATVFSSIDRRGRYAFGNQPLILAWNMVRLAECLLPLIDNDEQRAIAAIQPALERVPRRFEEAWQTMMAAKLGLHSEQPDDPKLIEDLLDHMKDNGLDYTMTFDGLGDALVDADALPRMRDALGPWLNRWLSRIETEPSRDEAAALMRRHNPVVIPRNHHVEAVLEQCIEADSGDPALPMIDVLRTPYTRRPETTAFEDPPADGDKGYQTFCGT